ncbi:hypothetical protein M413DRAFT_382906 [Hebeloma cylindrosporum]|uniref:G-protein coupled receptors family 1 profile domain-containing protein n=1 Tax=Hebeloma cylindrosporum TaxID=76867 RepID=A0A0C2Y0Z5_HEBCY|nr:hypothetical protein M413DRAFT_382906 [Hebeloma cylindrosporum h7]
MSLIPGADSYLEFKMLGTMISAITYGIVIVLSGNCFLLLQRKRGIYSNRMRLFLLIYVTIMLLFSTSAIILSILGITLLIFRDVNVPLPIDLPLLITYSPAMLPLTMWGADVFMIWRCVILYQDVARVPRILVIVLLSLLSILSLGSGVMTFIALTTDPIFTRVLIMCSTLVNIVLAALIILRLIYHQRHIRKVLGMAHGSPYSKVITMCVESSALIVIFGGVYTVLAFEQGNGSVLIPFLLLPHICVISPLLIVYRVAKGRAVTTTIHPSEQATAQIRFNDPPSIRSSQEEKEV